MKLEIQFKFKTLDTPKFKEFMEKEKLKLVSYRKESDGNIFITLLVDVGEK